MILESGKITEEGIRRLRAIQEAVLGKFWWVVLKDWRRPLPTSGGKRWFRRCWPASASS